MPVSKIYNALQTGVLDGVYISPGALYRPWRLAEPGEFVTAGHERPDLAVLHRHEQAGLERPVGGAQGSGEQAHRPRIQHAMAADFWGKIDAGQLKTAMTEQKGVKFHQLSEQEQAAAFDAATAKSVDAYLADKEKKGIPARAIYKAVTE